MAIGIYVILLYAFIELYTVFIEYHQYSTGQAWNKRKDRDRQLVSLRSVDLLK